jgi:tetratricopeptide (TPR) repeat protein
MNNELYINQLLDNYVQGKLTRENVIALLKEQGVSDAGYETDLHLAAVAAIQRNSVRLQVQNVHQRFLQSSQKADNTPPAGKAKVLSLMQAAKWMLRVAAVALIVSASWFAYTYFTTSSSSLYAGIYQQYDVNTDRASFDEIVQHNMVKQFKEKNYTAVIKTYRDLVVTNNREKFLTAIAYQETGNSAQAIDLLKQILQYNQEQKNRLYNDEAEFYLALNYLKLKNAEEAVPLFQKIYDDRNHTYHERISKAALRKLKWLQ